MRICFVSTFLPQPCGIATYTSYLSQGILKVDPHIQIVVLAEHGAERKTSGNIQCFPCFSRRDDYGESIINKLKEVKPDILHIQHEFGIFGTDDRFINFLKMIENQNYKKVVTLHTVFAQENINVKEINNNIEYYNLTLGNLCDKLIVHHHSERIILNREGIPKDKIRVIPHGTRCLNLINQEEARKKLNLPLRGKIILSAGFIRRTKNQLFLIKALPLVLQEVPEAYLFICGSVQNKADNLYFSYLMEKAKSLGIIDRVIINNCFIPEEDMDLLFSAADIAAYVDNSVCHSASGSFHLAIGAKLPFVATWGPKFAEEVVKYITDELLVINQDREGLARIIIRILNDEKFKEYVVERVSQYALQTSWENIAQRHLGLYKRIFLEKEVQTEPAKIALTPKIPSNY